MCILAIEVGDDILKVLLVHKLIWTVGSLRARLPLCLTLD